MKQACRKSLVQVGDVFSNISYYYLQKGLLIDNLIQTSGVFLVNMRAAVRERSSENLTKD